MRNVGASSTTSPNSATTQVQAVDGKPFAVESLGLTFALPDTFDSLDDDSYVFAARSINPRSLFSIDSDTSDVTDHAAEPGETLSDLELGEVHAVVVTDAVLDGLPPELSANELLVSNGSQSFSVIMSGPTEDLPELWEVFVGSVEVTPED